MAKNRLGHTMFLLLAIANLYSIIAILLLGLNLDNRTGPHFDNSYNLNVIFVVVDLGHPNFLTYKFEGHG
jgi:hypothetical protein